MSLILALDSSTDACSVALYRDGQVSSRFELASKSHTQRLLPMVDELLQANECRLKDLDAIAFGRGPGSFTGLRICVGVVQGLAFGANLPVIPISTLAAMALGFYRNFVGENAALNEPVIAALDARVGEVYWGVFRRDADLVRPITLEFCTAPELLINHPDVMLLESNFHGIGSGWQYPCLSELVSRSIKIDVYPSAENIALLAAQELFSGKLVDVKEAQPVYLRDSVAWKKRQPLRRIS